MTLYQYRLLPEDDQALATWQGECFLSMEEKEHTIMLYKVHGFYVEVYCSKEDNEVVRLNPFSSKKLLELYFNLQLN